jgi:hypothetical protein
VLALLALAALGARVAHGHDAERPDLDRWYAGLMQPDNPTASCCGEADAYWCDGLHVRQGKTFCVITDDRQVARRTPVPVGTEIEIPDRKLKWDAGNPTGHAIVFLSSGGVVYCYVQNGGV